MKQCNLIYYPHLSLLPRISNLSRTYSSVLVARKNPDLILEDINVLEYGAIFVPAFKCSSHFISIQKLKSEGVGLLPTLQISFNSLITTAHID